MALFKTWMAEVSSDPSQRRRLRSAGKPIGGVLTSTRDGCVLHGDTGTII